MQTRTSRYFAAIAQNNSIRDAADALHVAQSALSRQILKLEQELGVGLFERHPRGVVLTAAGEVYLRYARDQIAQAEHMRAEIDALNGMQRGTVRIHAIESLTSSLLPRLIAGFRKLHPGVRFEVMMAGSEHIIEAVRQIDTDIGMTYYSQPAADLEVRLSAREPLLAIVAAKHPLAKATRIGLREVAAFPTALTARGSRSRSLIDTACWKAGVSLSPVLESNSVELLTGLVEHSDAVTFLLKLSVSAGLRAKTLAAVPVRSEILNMGTIEVLTRSARKLSPVGEEFLAFLGTKLGSGGRTHERSV
jgi:DNA-binding transcriptional LysR family regulator